jgi:hypothetical protein
VPLWTGLLAKERERRPTRTTVECPLSSCLRRTYERPTKIVNEPRRCWVAPRIGVGRSGRDAGTVAWCRASLRVENTDGAARVWDSGLDEGMDHVEHLAAIVGIIREEGPSFGVGADVRVLLSVTRGGGGACALTVPADVIVDLAAAGAHLWIDAYQEGESASGA